MALTKYKIGDLIKASGIKCNIPNLLPDQVFGINKDKEFFGPSKQVGKDTSNYLLVKPNDFACNLMHVGRDVVLPVSLNQTDKDIIVSPAYSVFTIKDTNIVLPKYLFILLHSTEVDRLFWFSCDSSVREALSWKDFCDVEISLPPIEVQQKYVDIYNGLLSNQRSYEKSLKDLQLTFLAYIDKIKNNFEYKELANFIKECKNFNTDGKVNDFQGISVDMKFIPTVRVAKNKEKTKIVRDGDFAFNKIIRDSGTRFPITLRSGNDCAISSSYTVFKIKDNNILLNEYLMIWLSRSEIHRSLGFHSWGTTRDTISFKILCNIKIPLIPMNLQQYLADLFTTYSSRENINEKLKTQIKDICPVLIRGAIQEASNL